MSRLPNLEIPTRIGACPYGQDCAFTVGSRIHNPTWKQRTRIIKDHVRASHGEIFICPCGLCRAVFKTRKAKDLHIIYSRPEDKARAHVESGYREPDEDHWQMHDSDFEGSEEFHPERYNVAHADPGTGLPPVERPLFRGLDGAFYCSQCSFFTWDGRELAEHLSQKHGYPASACGGTRDMNRRLCGCGNVFENQASLINHKDEQHNRSRRRGKRRKLIRGAKATGDARMIKPEMEDGLKLCSIELPTFAERRFRPPRDWLEHIHADNMRSSHETKFCNGPRNTDEQVQGAGLRSTDELVGIASLTAHVRFGPSP